MKSMLYLPEDIICSQGDKITYGNEDYLYFLCRGQCEVFVYDENKEERYVTELDVGSYFGEIAILRGCQRTSTVKSKRSNYNTNNHNI